MKNKLALLLLLTFFSASASDTLRWQLLDGIITNDSAKIERLLANTNPMLYKDIVKNYASAYLTPSIYKVLSKYYTADSLVFWALDYKEQNLCKFIKKLPSIKQKNFLLDKIIEYYYQKQYTLYNPFVSKCIKKLINAGADPNKLNKNGRTALNLAVDSRDLDLLKFLYNHGADLRLLDDYGKKPLQLYFCGDYNDDVLDNFAQMFVFLVSHGVTIDTTALKSIINCAGQIGYLDVIMKMLHSTGWNINDTSLIPLGFISNVPYLVKTLINLHYKHLNLSYTICYETDTLFWYALNSGYKLPKDTDSLSALLMEAVYYNSMTVIDYLLKHGVDINYISPSNQTPLTIAIITHNLQLISYLINHGAKINIVLKSYKRTPLQYAVFYDFKDITAYLLYKGADPNIKDRSGLTALHTAVWTGDLDLVKLLISYGAKINVKDGQGLTPLEQAAINKNWDIVEYLLDVQGKNNFWNRLKLHFISKKADINSIFSSLWSSLKELIEILFDKILT